MLVLDYANIYLQTKYELYFCKMISFLTKTKTRKAGGLYCCAYMDSSFTDVRWEGDSP
jgi:hypothetical protein